MDGSRFDSLTKELSTVSSRRLARRAVLRGLAGALLGGIVAALPVGRRRTAAQGCSPDGALCSNHVECCSGACATGGAAFGECVASDPLPPPPPPPPPDSKDKKDKDKKKDKKDKDKDKKKDKDKRDRDRNERRPFDWLTSPVHPGPIDWLTSPLSEE